MYSMVSLLGAIDVNQEGISNLLGLVKVAAGSMPTIFFF